MLTPIDHPIAGQASTPASSSTARASSTNAVTSTRSGFGRPLRPADAAVVPRDHPHPAVGAQQRRPGVGAGPEAVAQQHGRTVDVVGPGAQPGAVAADDVVEAQRLPVLGHGEREDTRLGHGPSVPERAEFRRCGSPSAARARSRSPRWPGRTAPRGRRGTPRRRRALASLLGQGGGGDQRVAAGLVLAGDVPGGGRGEEPGQRHVVDARGAVRHRRQRRVTFGERIAASSLSRSLDTGAGGLPSRRLVPRPSDRHSSTKSRRLGPWPMTDHSCGCPSTRTSSGDPPAGLRYERSCRPATTCRTPSTRSSSTSRRTSSDPSRARCSPGCPASRWCRR